MKQAKDHIRKLADTLSNPKSDGDDLIYAFEDIEEARYDVAKVLHTLLEANQPIEHEVQQDTLNQKEPTHAHHSGGRAEHRQPGLPNNPKKPELVVSVTIHCSALRCS